MFLLFIAFIIIVAYLVPWVFRYFMLAPILGTCLGGFAWGVLGLLTGGLLFSPQAFAVCVLAGIVIVAAAINRSLS